MSTNLELQQKLIEIRLPSSKIKISQPSDGRDDGNGIIQSENSSSYDGEDCRTPKSPQNMIPIILTCPPAPKKPRRVASSSCKRKLSEFFESVAADEVESFFRQFDIKRRFLA